MLFQNLLSTATLLLLYSSLSLASLGSRFHTDNKAPKNQHAKRQYFPKPATGLKTITGPTGVQIRYKEPGKEGVCETTPGVNSYSGFIDTRMVASLSCWEYQASRLTRTIALRTS